MIKSILGSLILLGTLPSLGVGSDLSTYRHFHFGTDLPAIAKQTGVEPALAKTIHRRPALIQELEWRPQPLGPTSKAEAVARVVFSFYEGKLFRLTVDYDRYETEGLTVDDFVEAISATYGPAVRTIAPKANAEREMYGDQEESLAQWEDPEYRFQLVRTAYGPIYKLIGVIRSLEAQARTADLEAKRLDDLEAPQRDAARVASEEESARAKLEKARLVNKPKFRP